MKQDKIRACLMRGGTSRALFFHRADIPENREELDRILLAALGSPDPYRRQIDGLGGGISSLSKACIIGPPSRPDADIDYTFAQVEVVKASVDYSGSCGNCASAVGPFAIDEGLVKARDGRTAIRIHDTNTGKMIVAHVPVEDSQAMVEGDFEMAGIPGNGAKIALDFLDPAGGATGRLLPTGNPCDEIDGLDVSMVDCAIATVFVQASDLGLNGTETPTEIDARPAVLKRLELIRQEAGKLMGIPGRAAIPKVAVVAPPREFVALNGRSYQGSQCDMLARVMSMGNCHRAFALTAAMCLAAASRIPGSVVNRQRLGSNNGDIRIGHPSGLLDVGVRGMDEGGILRIESITTYRTARRLMEGWVRVPASRRSSGAGTRHAPAHG